MGDAETTKSNGIILENGGMNTMPTILYTRLLEVASPARARSPRGPGLGLGYVGPSRASGRKVLIASGLVAFEFFNQQFQFFCKIISFDFFQIPRLNLLSYFSVYLLTTHNIAPFIYYFILSLCSIRFDAILKTQLQTMMATVVNQIRYQLVRKLNAISLSINSNQHSYFEKLSSIVRVDASYVLVCFGPGRASGLSTSGRAGPGLKTSGRARA